MNRIPLYEPMTVFTDLLIVLCGLWFAREIQLWFNVRLMEVHWHFAKYFYMLALTAFFGAVYHAIYPEHETIRDFIWKLTMLGMGFSIFAMLLGTLYYFLPFDTVQIVKWGITAIIFIFTIWIYFNHDLINAVRLYIPSALFVMGVMLYGWFGKGDQGALWIMAGFVVTLGGASFTVTKFGFHKHFNHNDIFHVIQIAGMYLIYRGSMLITNYGFK
ncbi:MAG: hypothetical protein QF842_07255 [Candidatus Marinimicrobia bacterium]|jgi:hypothetical protein|nr:hypothetical protein [Candidatus Neomarinimicrobiota bacterium]MDP6611319.1 hypothetical protein [Candidatus Neomarinimicrobiota bacterium]|tara:strand:- start:547 stop:1194 length:648 start_codon:yes stop_codon:yes gene_type:complete